MPIPPQLLKAIQNSKGNKPADAQDPPGSKQDVNPFLAQQGQHTKKKKKKYTPAQQKAIQQRLAGGKGSGRN